MMITKYVASGYSPSIKKTEVTHEIAAQYKAWRDGKLPGFTRYSA